MPPSTPSEPGSLFSLAGAALKLSTIRSARDSISSEEGKEEGHL